MSRTRWIILAAVLCLACCVILPSNEKVRDGEGWIRSQNSLKQIGLALLNYEHTHGKFPPAVIRDERGKALYSWRVVILPFLDEDRLYDKFKLNEPWDSPHNKPLLADMPSCYVPFLERVQAPYATHYQVIVGPGTAFERAGLSLRDFPDGLANTILAVEAGEPVPWTKPSDLEYHPDKALPSLGGVYAKPTYFFGYPARRKAGFNAVFADGSARFLVSDTDEGTIRGLITRNGGEEIDLSKPD
jgi:Protein of unknown function (DUF1559)